MIGNKSVPDDHSSSDDRVADALAAILQRAAREGRDDERVEADSGVNRHTIKAYRLKARKPSLAAGLMICGALGEWAVNRLLHLIRFQATPLDEVDTLKPMEITANAMKHLATIAGCAADGRIDHTEVPMCREAADMIMATVLPLSSAGQAL